MNDSQVKSLNSERDIKSVVSEIMKQAKVLLRVEVATFYMVEHRDEGDGR